MPIIIGALGTVHKRLVRGLEELEIGEWTKKIQLTALLKSDTKSSGHLKRLPWKSFAENGQNPKTSPGDLRRFAVTQTPVKNHQLTLMWKTLKG